MSTCHTVDYDDEDGDRITKYEIGYSYSRPGPATYLDPPYGGVELDYITCTGITFLDDDGTPTSRRATQDEIDAAGRLFSSERAWWIASNDWQERDDDARESAAEARAEARAERLQEEGY